MRRRMFYIQEVNQCAISNVFASRQTTFPAACSLRKDSNLGICFVFNTDFSDICKSNIKLFLGGMYKTNLCWEQNSSKIIYNLM